MSGTLAQRIKKYREKSNWSQQKLAEESRLSIGQIQSMEIGRIADPGKEVLIKLADAFGISIDELIGRELPRAKKRTS
jgi:transcriptional regulator with XRE-family HTH domain